MRYLKSILLRRTKIETAADVEDGEASVCDAAEASTLQLSNLLKGHVSGGGIIGIHMQ